MPLWTKLDAPASPVTTYQLNIWVFANRNSQSQRFHSSELQDPIAKKRQGYFFREDNHFGVISLCPNPYSDEDGKYFCILAAGSHGPGTDMAVRVLAKNETVHHRQGKARPVNGGHAITANRPFCFAGRRNCPASARARRTTSLAPIACATSRRRRRVHGSSHAGAEAHP